MQKQMALATTGMYKFSSGYGLSLLGIISNPISSLVRVSSATIDFAKSTSDKEKHNKIMVVDDDKDISFIFKSALQRSGFEVDVFNDPMEALKHFKPDYYDLLLFDVRMPNMSGFELYREIQKEGNKTKVCFISAFEIHKEELEKIIPAFDGRCIIKKPITIKDLVKAVKEEVQEDD